MDQLSKDAVAATNAGLTYGKYMAKKETLAATNAGLTYGKYMAKKETLAAAYEGVDKVKKCLFCGCPLPRGKGNRRYCNAECAEKYREQQAQKSR